MLAGIAATATIVYAALAVAVWAFQDRLVFYPRAASGPPRAPAGWTLHDFHHVTADGTRLEGVLLRPPAARDELVVYYGGNAEEVTAFAAEAEGVYGRRPVLLVNYRGYGRSGGRPAERALVADSLEIIDRVVREGIAAPDRIVVHGRSLGTGVATQVAAARPMAAVILTSAFGSAADVAAEMYAWLPVRMLMRHPFDSAAHAARVRTPLLLISGDADTLIHPRHTDRLGALWAGPVTRVRFPGRGHGDVSDDPGYAAAVRAFLDRTLGSDVRK